MRATLAVLFLVGLVSLFSCTKNESITSGSNTWISSFSVVENSFTKVYSAPDFYFSAKDSSGNLYANVNDVTSNYTWYILRSTDQGATWSVSDTNPTNYSTGWGLTGDSLGNIFALGSTSANNTFYSGAIRKFDGTSWSDSLTYQFSTGSFTDFRAATVDASDNVYVIGSGNTGTPVSTDKMIILKSTNHGASWSLINSFSVYESQFATGTAIVVNGSTIYVSGISVPVFSGARHSSYVRKSTDGGTTWSTIYESFDYSQIKGMVAWNNGIAIIIDYYTGSNFGYTKVLATADDFQHLTELYSYAPASHASGYAGSLSVDPRGYLYASGVASDTGGTGYTFIAAFRNGTWEKIVDLSGSNSQVVDDVFFDGNNNVFYIETNSPDGIDSTYRIHKATISDPEVFTLSPIGNGSARVSPIPANAKIIYLTTTLTNGNLGSTPALAVSAADSICNNDPHKPVYASGSFKALITASGARIACTTGSCSGGASEHTDWPLAASTQYVTRDGLAFGTTNATGLFTSINATYILAKYGFGAWSGFDQSAANYWMLDSGVNCSDWSSSSNGDSGWTFDPTQTVLTDFYSQSSSNSGTCDEQRPLICIEQ